MISPLAQPASDRADAGGGQSIWEITPGPLLLWLCLQIAALALSAARVPLAAHYSRPAESEALRVMLLVQAAAAALLFASICRTWGQAIASAASAAVFLLMASALAARPLTDAIPGIAFMASWLVALGAWCAALPRGRAPLIASAAAATYLLGGILLWYLRMEFSETADARPTLAFGPLLQVVASPYEFSAGAIAMNLALLVIALLARFSPRFLRKKRR